MHIIHRDEKQGRIRLRAETLDDLWHLYHIIKEQDWVYALTYRREESPADQLRTKKSEKKKMVLGIEVEKVEFADFSDRLRILGVIREGQQDIGSYHTLILEAGDDLTVVKKDWKQHFLDRIKEAVEATKRPLVTFLAIEDGCALIARLHHYGVEQVANIEHNIPGKQYKGTKGEKAEFFADVLSTIKSSVQDGSPIIILGPGFAKEEFVKYARPLEPGLLKQAHIEATGQAGMTGITEAMKSGVVSKASQGCRVEEETMAVERLLAEISKNGLAAYGPKEVKGALLAGSVETLLITDKLVREGNGDEYLELARRTNSGALIISVAHEGGRKLESLSGYGAILRYQIRA